MSKFGQQWVMLRSNCGRASSFRHGNAVWKRGKEFTLFCLHSLRCLTVIYDSFNRLILALLFLWQLLEQGLVQNYGEVNHGAQYYGN